MRLCRGAVEPGVGRPCGRGAIGAAAGPRWETAVPDLAASRPRPGTMTHARDCLAILERLPHLRPGQALDDDDRELLGRWRGWGPLAPALDPRAEGTWRELRACFLELLDDAARDAALAATATSFYTPPWLAAALWESLAELGLPVGARVLEPGCGHGAFLASAPPALGLRWTAVERDPTSAAIARLLHPGATVVTSALERLALPEASFDLAVGNVPFSDTTIYDPTAPARFSLHNYFLWRALRALRPGGIAALISSRFTLDAEGEATRVLLADEAELLGAIRLPRGALGESGTEITADLLLLRRHRRGEAAPDRSWTHCDTLHGQPWNSYFIAHPEQVVGELTEECGAYGPGYGVTFSGTSRERAAAVREALARTATQARSDGRTLASDADAAAPPGAVLVDAEGRAEGSFHLLYGLIVQVVDGGLVPVAEHAELRLLIQLREATLQLLAAEADSRLPDDALTPKRRLLNQLYEQYRRRFGPLNRCTFATGKPDPETGEPTVQRRRPPMGGFRADPDYVTVLALEDFDDETGEAHKAPLLLRRVNRRPSPPPRVASPGDALALSLDRFGRVDLAHIAGLLGRSADEARAQLGTLVYDDPASGGLETAEAYLSGNVRAKLRQARLAASLDDRYAVNVAALERIVPADLLPGEIRARLGAPWIDARHVRDFIEATIGPVAAVHHVRAAARWDVEADLWARARPEATTKWGTARVDAYSLVAMALNGTAPVVYDEQPLPDGGSTRIRNTDETLAAQDRLDALNARFVEWLWESPVRADELCRIYNDRFNSTVVRHYDGSHLTFPGLLDGFQPYAAQRDAVHRIVSSPATLCGYAVGAGKTAIMFMAAMTLRRLGLAAKPLIVVPNHLLEQVAREGKRLFPMARILMAAREDVSAERRRLFAARCATGDWDAVVITHSAFTALAVSNATEAHYVSDSICRYQQSLLDDGSRSRSVKAVAELVEKLRQRQAELLDHRTDDGVSFEQCGVDFLLVDESHYFKRLALPCHTDGFSIEGSKRATDLHMKIAWLRNASPSGRCGALFTGTPVTNSLAELYVLQTYLQPDRLDELELDSFDAWARTFIDFETRIEVAPDGGSFRLHTRPSRFTNVPELRTIFAEVADIRSADDLDLHRPDAVYETEVVPPPPELLDFVAGLVQRANRLRTTRTPRLPDGRLDNMLLVCTDGRKAALDLSLVGLRTAHKQKVDYVAERLLQLWRHQPPVPHSVDGGSATPRPTRTSEQTTLFGAEASAARRSARPPVAGGTTNLQLVFCDLGTPRSGDPQVYGLIRDRLVAGGMPRELIRFVHEASTDQAKAALFADCRAGRVAVLIASTDKAGVGTNIQNRCIAIHHVDAPWRPTDVEQRDGRALRKGNLHASVRVIRYVTERSFDAYMWQTLERKARFIWQVLTGRLTSRDVEDLGDGVLSFSQVKALATGNPLLLDHAAAEAELSQLRRLATAHAHACRRAQAQAAQRRDDADAARRRGALWTAIAATSISDPARVDRAVAEAVAAAAIDPGLLPLPAGRWGELAVAVLSFNRVRAPHAGITLTDAHGATVRLDLPAIYLRASQQWQAASSLSALLAAAPAHAEQEAALAADAAEQAESAAALARQPFAQAQRLLEAERRFEDLDRQVHEEAETPAAA